MGRRGRRKKSKAARNSAWTGANNHLQLAETEPIVRERPNANRRIPPDAALLVVCQEFEVETRTGERNRFAIFHIILARIRPGYQVGRHHRNVPVHEKAREDDVQAACWMILFFILIIFIFYAM